MSKILLFVFLTLLVSSEGAPENGTTKLGLDDCTQSCIRVGQDEIQEYIRFHGISRTGYEDGMDMFICETMYEGRIYQGNFFMRMGMNGTGVPSGTIAAGNYKHDAYAYQILDTQNEHISWASTSVDKLPRCSSSSARAVGADEGNNLTKHVCRLNDAGNLIIGRAVARHGNCFNPYLGNEMGIKNYELIVAKSNAVAEDEGCNECDDVAILASACAGCKTEFKCETGTCKCSCFCKCSANWGCGCCCECNCDSLSCTSDFDCTISVGGKWWWWVLVAVVVVVVVAVMKFR